MLYMCIFIIYLIPYAMKRVLSIMGKSRQTCMTIKQWSVNYGSPVLAYVSSVGTKLQHSSPWWSQVYQNSPRSRKECTFLRIRHCVFDLWRISYRLLTPWTQRKLIKWSVYNAAALALMKHSLTYKKSIETDRDWRLSWERQSCAKKSVVWIADITDIYSWAVWSVIAPEISLNRS